MKIYCEDCGRQILPGKGIPDEYVTYGPPLAMFRGFVCHYCGKDYDENGLLPEESEIEFERNEREANDS